MATTQTSTQTEVQSRPNDLDALDGDPVDKLVVVGGEDSMPNDRSEAVQEIDEAVVESPFEPTSQVAYRGQTNHVDAMEMWVASRQKLDPDATFTGIRHDVEWPDDDDSDARNEDGCLKSDVVSQLFDNRNNRLLADADALVIVTSGAENDYLNDITGAFDARNKYDHTLADVDVSDAEDALGL